MGNFLQGWDTQRNFWNGLVRSFKPSLRSSEGMKIDNKQQGVSKRSICVFGSGLFYFLRKWAPPQTATICAFWLFRLKLIDREFRPYWSIKYVPTWISWPISETDGTNVNGIRLISFGLISSTSDLFSDSSNIVISMHSPDPLIPTTKAVKESVDGKSFL